MNLPKQPKEGEPVKHFASEVINWMRANTLNHVKGGRLKRSTNGTTVEVIEPKSPSIQEIYDLLPHPWKCTASGGNTIYVGEGRIHSYLDGDTTLASVSMAGFGDWAGGDVTVTAATGVIYGTVAAAGSFYPIFNLYASSAGETGDVQISLMRTTPDPMGTITVGFAETMPIDSTGMTYYWEIAQVSLTDGVANITKQVLRHDPMLWSFLEFP